MFGKKCPICSKPVGKDKSLISKIYDFDYNIYKEMKPKTNFIMNVFVIDHTAMPNLEGKVKRLYLSKEVNDMLLDELFDDDDPKHFYDWDNGNIIKFTIKLKDNGYNVWSIKLLKQFDMKKTNIKKIDVPSLDELELFYSSKLLSYVDYNNKVADILAANTQNFTIMKEKVETANKDKEHTDENNKKIYVDDNDLAELTNEIF